MPSRLPLHPPPRALHYVTSNYRLPICGYRPRLSAHVTVHPNLATCPKCCAVLTAEHRETSQASHPPAPPEPLVWPELAPCSTRGASSGPRSRGQAR